MKHLTLTLFIFTLVLGACEKSKISLKNEAALIGEYEWAYSFGPNNESESFQTISDKYGIVLKKNGNVKIYKNDELAMSGFVADVTGIVDGKQVARIVVNEHDIYLTFTGNELEYPSYPIENHTNLFQKQ